jgi:hypothetical protein
MKNLKKTWLGYLILMLSIAGIAITDQGIAEMLFCLALVSCVATITRKEIDFSKQNQEIVYEKVKQNIL